MALDDHWFTEKCIESGSAFSLKIDEKLHDEKTPFQHIEIYKTTGFGNLMVIDGFIMLSDRDNFIYHEMLSHPVLFTHNRPEKVLIIGGGDCGTLREVLKHESVTELHQIEIDERVTRLAEKYFPELCSSNGDSRANLHFEDGIQWVADAGTDCYDIIIIDSTDPIGPAEGLFTEAFYRNCHKALAADGILVQQSESPLFHMRLLNSMRQAMLAAGFPETRTINFPQCVYPSGWWSATLAGKAATLSKFREKDIIAKPFKTQYYNLDIHKAALANAEFLKDGFNQ